MYHTVLQALKLSSYVAATVQQQSRSKFVWTTTCYACVDIAYACVQRVL